MSTLIASILLCLVLSICCGIVWFFIRDMYQSISSYGIPAVMTPEYKRSILLEHLDLRDGMTFIDIGCGDGALLEAVEKKYPKSKVIGYEISAKLYGQALHRKQSHDLRYEIRKMDFFDADISEADVLYSYMISYLMPRIWKKISNECRPGTRVYSSSFGIAGVEPIEILQLANTQYIYVYRV